MLLILLYLAPFVALALHWRAQHVTAGLEAASTAEASGSTLMEIGRTALKGRVVLARPLAAALVASVVVVAAADGFSAAAALVAGGAFALLGMAGARASVQVALGRDDSTAGAVWVESCGMALASASFAAGAIGGLAWFFADPSGVVVLAAFLLGASSASLLVAMGTGCASSTDNAWPGEAAARALTAPLQVHFAALAATWMVAATAEPEGILGLGGLMAETETLRSELLLLPVAVTLLSPVVAMLASPLYASMPTRAGAGEFVDVERVAALGTAMALLAVVLVGGLSWAVAASILVGLVARHVALLFDEGALKASRAGRGWRSAPAAMPALVAAVALVAGERLAGAYGVALAALGFSSTFACASAATLAHRLFALRHCLAHPPVHAETGAADAAAGLAATMALLVASGPVLVAESVHRGLVVDLVVAAAPALMMGTVVGAAAAAGFAARLARGETQNDTLRMAAWAVAATALLPALAGVMFGAAAAFGAALGIAARAASAPQTGEDDQGLPGPVMLAWARTMAMSALVSAPLMNG